MSALRRDILYTIIGQGVVAAALFVQYRIVRASWGVEALSSYSLVFRVRGAIEWIVVLVIPLALTRQLSAELSRDSRTEVTLVGVPFTILLIGAACLILLVSPPFTATVLFGRSDYEPWVVPFCALLAAYCLVLLITGVLRGIFAFREASLASLIALALIPTVSLLFGGRFPLTQVVTFAGLMSATATLIGLAVVVMRHDGFAFGTSARPPRERVFGRIGGLVAFGAPRLITLGASALFMVCLPWMLARQADHDVLAPLNVMMALLAAAALVTSPIGFVLLPHVSRTLAQGDRARAGGELRLICSATLFAGIVAGSLALGFMQDVLAFLFGKGYHGDVALQDGITLAMPFFLFIDILRSPLDAASRFPLNAFIYLAGLVATVAVYLMPLPEGWFSVAARCAMALVAGYLAAATACFACAKHCFGLSVLSRRDLTMILLWITALLIWLWVRRSSEDAGMANRVFAFFAVACCALYARVARPEWLRMLGVSFRK
jgi:O-antigen/teichoic acid export membrane protein